MMMHPRSRQEGVSLIEVMIAVFLLMIGLLGIMGVQIFSQRQVVTSAQRSIVIQATTNVIERMRANNVGAVCGMYVNGGVSSAPLSCGSSAATGSSTQAAQDLNDWRDQLKSRLGPVTANVTVSANGTYLISVMWNERDAMATDPACPNNTPAGSRCFNTSFIP